MKLQRSNVLITGAARRIGREIALTLGEAGARIIVHYRRSKKEALSLCCEIERRGGEARPIQADFSALHSPVALKRFVRKAWNLFDSVEVFINNASVFYRTPFGKIKERDWDDNLTTNLKIPFFLSQEIGLKMVKAGQGKIINLVDWVGQRPPKDFLPYGISKAGLVSATVGLARVLAPRVQVIGVAPGPILPAVGMSLRHHEAAAKKTLLKRYGDPKDIAKTLKFLIEGTDFITGTVISVDGGACIA